MKKSLTESSDEVLNYKVRRAMVAGEVLLNFYPSFFRFDNQKSRFYSPLHSTVSTT